MSEYVDPEDNHAMLCWFEEDHRTLKITASSVLEMTTYNPFNFLVYPPEYLNAPFTYRTQYIELLASSLHAEELSDPMENFLHSALKKTENQTIPFLTELTRQIHATCTIESRETGDPHHPVHTFKQKRGSCRDLAWMQIHMLRSIGIAARFVSGYYYIPGDQTEFELHAWVEAYIPGAGWFGLDPGHGIAIGGNHIPVVASSFYEQTMPVTGSYRGLAVSRLQKDLKITPVQ